jgi:hypothetical protein
MNPNRHLSLYDGQRRLGSIVGNDGSYVAKDASGKTLGEFATVQKAVDAINKTDIGRPAK